MTQGYLRRDVYEARDTYEVRDTYRAKDILKMSSDRLSNYSTIEAENAMCTAYSGDLQLSTSQRFR